MTIPLHKALWNRLLAFREYLSWGNQHKLTDDQLQAIHDILFNPSPKTQELLPEWRSTLFEQYKLFVEMADKISERRHNTNSFFLTGNTLFITIFGALIAFDNSSPGRSGISVTQLRENPALGIIAISVAIAGILLCAIWWSLIMRYRNLNHQKFTIIHQLENHLPTKPYMAEEKVPTGNFKGLTKAEQFTPLVFAILYMVIIGVLIHIYQQSLLLR